MLVSFFLVFSCAHVVFIATIKLEHVAKRLDSLHVHFVQLSYEREGGLEVFFVFEQLLLVFELNEG